MNEAREEALPLSALRAPCFLGSGTFNLSLFSTCPVEEVVCRVGHQLSLTDGAGRGRRSAAPRVQTLNERGLEQQVSARGPLLVSNRLEQQAGNRAAVGATVRVIAGIDRADRLGPNLAGVERTLPGGISAERNGDARLRAGIDAGEVGDDLLLLAEQIGKQSGFGPRVNHGPGGLAVLVGQANVAL